MNMRTVHDSRPGNVCDPYDGRGHTGLIDKMIGNAYDVVKYVARHLDVIRYVATNMENIYVVATNLKRSVLVISETGLANTTKSVALPEGVTPAMVVASSVLVQDANGDLFGSDSGYFTASIQSGALRLFLKPDAPANLENAVIRWFLTYGVA